MTLPRITPLHKLTALVLSIAFIVFLFGKTFVGTRQFVRFQLNGREYTAVVSRKTSEITLGLSGREDIGADAMLFLLPQKSKHLFWMYKMRFPLDFIWLADGKVVDLHHDVPIPSSQAIEEIPTASPEVAADSVLEVPAGFIAEQGIQEGQNLKLTSSFFRRVW